MTTLSDPSLVTILCYSMTADEENDDFKNPQVAGNDLLE